MVKVAFLSREYGQVGLSERKVGQGLKEVSELSQRHLRTVF